MFTMLPFFSFFFICVVIAKAFASNVLIRLCHECVGPMMHNDQQPYLRVQLIKHVSKFC